MALGPRFFGGRDGLVRCVDERWLKSSVAYEAWPPVSKPALHSVFVGGWGMPIGEMFDLRELAAQCEQLGRWTFFFASVAINNPAGVASTGNAQAIL